MKKTKTEKYDASPHQRASADAAEEAAVASAKHDETHNDIHHKISIEAGGMHSPALQQDQYYQHPQDRNYV